MNSNTPIVLKLEGLGHVPGKKNNKMIARGRLITKPEYQEWIQRATRSLESQCRYGSVITAGGISMDAQQPCSILSLPLDDSWQWVRQIVLEGQKVAKGSEGAVITIERIN